MCRSAYIEVFGASSARESFEPDDEDLSDDSDGLDVLSEDQLESQGWLQPDSRPVDRRDVRDQPSPPSAGQRIYSIHSPDTVRVGNVYSVRSPNRGIVLVSRVSVESRPDAQPMYAGTSLVDGVTRGVFLGVDTLGDESGGAEARLRVNPFGVDEETEWAFAADHISNPYEVGVLLQGNTRAILSCEAISFRCIQRDADEHTWHVAGRGDIWTLELRVKNEESYPIDAAVIREQLRVMSEDMNYYPALAGMAQDFVGAHLDWPRQWKRFEYGSPPLLPKMETTGMLGYLLPSGGGMFHAEGAFSPVMYRMQAKHGRS